MLGKPAKILSILVALAMVMGAMAVFSPLSTARDSEVPRYATPVSIDMGPVIRGSPVSMEAVSALMEEASLNLDILGAYYDLNDSMEFYDDYGGVFIEMTKRGEGDHCEVWVADDLSFPDGDPRNDEPWNWSISYAQVQYIIQQFDEVIYPIEAEFFGEPANLTGDDALMRDWGFDFAQNMDGTKTMIVIENIVDENFEDPSYPYYVAGYFSPSSKLYYDRNIIHIDCWDWTNRTGGSSERPYLYEAVVSHEYQHLLHDTYDEDEDLWLNEGLSMYAEFLCNYSGAWDNIQRFLYSPDNSLIDWGDQSDINILADYGSAMLFMIYLNDHFGGSEFISDLFHCEENGIESIDQCLSASTHPDWTFERAFWAFRLANLIHSDAIGDGFFNYENVSWTDPDAIELYDGDWPLYDIVDGYRWASQYFGNTLVYDTEDESGLHYDTRHSGVGAYGTDYFMVYPNLADEYLGLKFFFDGMDQVASGWTEAPMATIYEEGFGAGDIALDGWMAYSDGFDSSPWTIGSWSGGDDAPWCDARTSEFIEEFLTMNGDVIDASDAEELVAEFYLYYEDYGGSYLEMYAITPGQGWEVVETFTSDMYGTVRVDLSQYAGEEELRLGFGYFADLDMYVLVDDIVVYDPTEMCWYSGASDWVDLSLMGTADLTGSVNSTLTFQTSYEIEELWDFGFVQVSTDGGETWTSLVNDHTTSDTDPSARPLIVENVPGLTGSSDGWMEMEFDLSEYDGQEIMFQFRYVTDWAYTELGWFLCDVTVNGVEVVLEPAYPEVDWMVTVYCPAHGTMPDLVFDLNLNSYHETLRSFHAVAMLYDEVFIVVSPMVGMSDYTFGMYGEISD